MESITLSCLIARAVSSRAPNVGWNSNKKRRVSFRSGPIQLQQRAMDSANPLSLSLLALLSSFFFFTKRAIFLQNACGILTAARVMCTHNGGLFTVTAKWINDSDLNLYSRGRPSELWNAESVSSAVKFEIRETSSWRILIKKLSIPRAATSRRRGRARTRVHFLVAISISINTSGARCTKSFGKKFIHSICRAVTIIEFLSRTLSPGLAPATRRKSHHRRPSSLSIAKGVGGGPGDTRGTFDSVTFLREESSRVLT